MKLWNSKTKEEISTVSQLSYCNPFSPERLKLEKLILGREFSEEHDSWHISMNPDGQRPNIGKLEEFSLDLAETSRTALLKGAKFSEGEEELYRNLVNFTLYHQHHNTMAECIDSGPMSKTYQSICSSSFHSLRKGLHHFFDDVGLQKTTDEEAAHQMACVYQIRRAFQHIFTYITGASRVSTELRSEIWHSIFSHNMSRYVRLLYHAMKDIPVLITGPSGSGKELVARAIGLSGYIPFDLKQERFQYDHNECLLALNLSAISPLLIESELFGHKRGAYTGAVSDVEGWLSKCHSSASLFLDEIGDLETNIQVKLLRVLQTRTFQEVGSTKNKTFQGRIIAATNCNLPDKIKKGEFRSDFFYRLCADNIQTPSLHQILQDTPSDITRMVEFISAKLIGEDEAGQLCKDVLAQLKTSELKNHTWPGNFRELEQCVKNILVRKKYNPPAIDIESGSSTSHTMDRVEMTADELLGLYYRKAYEKYGSFEEAARILKVDRRTVKSRMAPSS